MEEFQLYGLSFVVLLYRRHINDRSAIKNEPPMIRARSLGIYYNGDIMSNLVSQERAKKTLDKAPRGVEYHTALDLSSSYGHRVRLVMKFGY